MVTMKENLNESVWIHKGNWDEELKTGVKFFLANNHHHNWQPIHQSLTLRITMNPTGHFG